MWRHERLEHVQDRCGIVVEISWLVFSEWIDGWAYNHTAVIRMILLIYIGLLSTL